MEVHTHTHTERKRWTHYLWEFLMLFLAVFCGFLAENQREHYVEKKREKQFMISLVKDLELDTVQLSSLLKYRDNKLKRIDSVIRYFSRQTFSRVPVQCYTAAMQLFGHGSFFQNTGTLDQLKNSGGLRLITHRGVVDSIEKYDREIRRMVRRDEREIEVSFSNTSLCEKLFDGKELTKIYLDTISPQQPVANKFMIRLNSQYIDEYLNQLRDFRLLSTYNQNVQATLKDIAGRLISQIKKEYHLQ